MMMMETIRITHPSYTYEYYTEVEEKPDEPQRDDDPRRDDPKREDVHEPRPKRKLPQPRTAASEVSSVATADLKEMLEAKARSSERAKPALSQVKLEEFHGGRSHYHDWKRVLQAQQALYGRVSVLQGRSKTDLEPNGHQRDDCQRRSLKDPPTSGGGVWSSC